MYRRRIPLRFRDQEETVRDLLSVSPDGMQRRLVVQGQRITRMSISEWKHPVMGPHVSHASCQELDYVYSYTLVPGSLFHNYIWSSQNGAAQIKMKNGNTH